MVKQSHESTKQQPRKTTSTPSRSKKPKKVQSKTARPSPGKITRKTKKVSTAQSRSNAAYRAETKKTLKTLGIVTAIVIAIGALIYGAAWFNRHNEVTKAQKKIETYLEEKYGQEFVVKKSNRFGNLADPNPTMVSEAYPVNNSAIQFTASMSQNYAKDDYLTALWQGDGRAYVGPLIERAYGGDVEYDISVITPTQITKDLTVSLERALTQGRVPLRVRIIGSEKVTALNKRSLAKGVYSLAQELRVDGVQVFNIQYRVKNSNGAIEYGYSIGGSTRMSLDELIKNAKEDDIKS